MNDLVANFRQSAADVRSTKMQGIGDGNRNVSDKELEGLAKQMSQMTLSEQNEAINFLRKNDPELRSLMRAYQPITPAQR